MKLICKDLADLKKALDRKNGVIDRPCCFCNKMLSGCLRDDEAPICDDCVDKVCKTCGGTGSYYEDVAGDGGSRMEIPCDCCENDEEE